MSGLSLAEFDLADKYRHILDHCEPFLISYPANWPALDLQPFGVSIHETRRYTATALNSADVVNGLHHLDAATFGDQDMLMPRWVLFDCGEFPGIVFGFGVHAKALPEPVRAHYHVPDRDDAFVPLSMWVAIRCAEEGAWFGHNLSSANLLLKGDHALPGLATLTKVLGVKLTRATKQYGATQWNSSSIGLHLRLGHMEILSAFTPAHTHAETFTYRIDVDDEQLVSSLHRGYERSVETGDRVFGSGDGAHIRALHNDIENGGRYRLIRAERRENSQRLHLRRVEE